MAAAFMLALGSCVIELAMVASAFQRDLVRFADLFFVTGLLQLATVVAIAEASDDALQLNFAEIDVGSNDTPDT